jgi:hypothetical protein
VAIPFREQATWYMLCFSLTIVSVIFLVTVCIPSLCIVPIKKAIKEKNGKLLLGEWFSARAYAVLLMSISTVVYTILRWTMQIISWVGDPSDNGNALYTAVQNTFPSYFPFFHGIPTILSLVVAVTIWRRTLISSNSTSTELKITKGDWVFCIFMALMYIVPFFICLVVYALISSALPIAIVGSLLILALFFFVVIYSIKVFIVLRKNNEKLSPLKLKTTRVTIFSSAVLLLIIIFVIYRAVLDFTGFFNTGIWLSYNIVRFYEGIWIMLTIGMTWLLFDVHRLLAAYPFLEKIRLVPIP